MQLGIAAHSGEYSEDMREKVYSFLTTLSEECQELPILFLGGYWGLMKEIVDQATALGFTVVMILPVEHEEVYPPKEVILVKTGMEFRARSVPLVRSSDAIVALGGGVGTEIEVLMAYGMGKPVYVLVDTGYSTDLLQKAYPEYFDHRAVVKVKYFRDPKAMARDLCGLKEKGRTLDFG
ncbi:MAG: hypothetical protein ASUL_06698 [Candidatus Aramenus sulfurataquae]|jgi:uncharacterized protein (TIGR00725 family)|uniref:LOG family protein n=2 Tax=Candidatus Aramenus sulfurataquae TaxID=1326980 RepID=W7KIP9_9CREN|nr:MAG: hypothetical protein ASUL_06698 [Candidatus Aramenus sulfurataquae]MCL7343927.1 LOG family protein [Candidatus Aramenus sulfurataquae]